MKADPDWVNSSLSHFHQAKDTKHWYIGTECSTTIHMEADPYWLNTSLKGHDDAWVGYEVWEDGTNFSLLNPFASRQSLGSGAWF